MRDLKRRLGHGVTDDDVDIDGVSNFAELVTKISDILMSKASAAKTKNVVIALSNAEILRQLDSFLIPGFLRLAELTQLNICVIFISRIPWSRWQIIQVLIMALWPGQVLSFLEQSCIKQIVAYG